MIGQRVKVQGDYYHGVIPDGAVYIGRGAPGLAQSPFRNPFKPGRTVGCRTRQDAVYMHDQWLLFGDTAPYPEPGESKKLAALRDDVLARIEAGELDGRDVACWCRTDQPCHGDALLRAVQEIRSRPAHVGGAR
jgi:hypothetical protein